MFPSFAKNLLCNLPVCHSCSWRFQVAGRGANNLLLPCFTCTNSWNSHLLLCSEQNTLMGGKSEFVIANLPSLSQQLPSGWNAAHTKGNGRAPVSISRARISVLYPKIEALNPTEWPGLMKPELLLFIFNAHTPVISSMYVDSNPEFSN